MKRLTSGILVSAQVLAITAALTLIWHERGLTNVGALLIALIGVLSAIMAVSWSSYLKVGLMPEISARFDYCQRRSVDLILLSLVAFGLDSISTLYVLESQVPAWAVLLDCIFFAAIGVVFVDIIGNLLTGRFPQPKRMRPETFLAGATIIALSLTAVVQADQDGSDYESNFISAIKNVSTGDEVSAVSAYETLIYLTRYPMQARELAGLAGGDNCLALNTAIEFIVLSGLKDSFTQDFKYMMQVRGKLSDTEAKDIQNALIFYSNRRNVDYLNCAAPTGNQQHEI